MSKRSLSKSKYLKADVFKHRGVILRVSMIISVSAVMLAFNMKSDFDPDYELPDPLETNVTLVEPTSARKLTKLKVPKTNAPERVKAVDELSATKELFGEVENKNTDPDLDGVLDLEGDSVVDEKPVPRFHMMPEVTAVFPGGDPAREKFIQDNLKWTEFAKDYMEGSVKVFIHFVVDEKGKVRNIDIKNDPGFGMKKEVAKMMKKMPDWTPARMGSHPVGSPLQMTIRLTLSDY